MIRYRLALSLAALVLGNTALAQEQIAGHTIIRTADPSIWTGDAASGPLLHKESNTVFAERIGDFKRMRVMAVDNGRDVLAYYAMPRDGGATEISIYLFQPGSLPEHSLRGSLSALAMGHFDQIIWSDGPFDIDAPSKLRMFKGTYKTGIGPHAVMDYLYFGALGKWTVKVRATLPLPRKIEDEQAIDAFVRALPWASLLTANGACTGLACDAGRTMPIDNHPAEMMLARLIGSGAGTLPKNPAAPLFSRRAGDVTWEVQPLDALFVRLLAESFGGVSAKAPLYTLGWHKGTESGIVRFFTGTPSEAMFNRTVDVLIEHPEESAFVDAKAATFYLLE